ncbi:MAG: hypothetical protein WC046_01995 [Candidatus Bathyarchaeia archaeon]
MLKTNKPYGIRDVQRALNLSSPSIAQYHMSKLEHAGLLKRDGGNWVVNRVMLDNRIKVGRFLIPRYFFYTIFAVVVFLGGFIIKLDASGWEYIYFMVATLLFVLIFGYETSKVWLKGKL